MEKKPIFGRLILVAIVGALALSQWYPKTLDQDMVEVFRTKVKGDVDTAVIFDRLEKAKTKLEPGEKLSLDAWTNAIGASVDLRDIIREDVLREVFPNVIPEKGDENRSEEQKKSAEKAKRKTLKPLKLSDMSWEKPTDKDSSAVRRLKWHAKNKINREILKKIEDEASGKIRLGLDLSGGVQFVAKLQAKDDPDNPGEKLPITEGQIERAIETIRARVDEFGVSEPIIQKFGTDSIIIQSPSLSQIDRERIREIIQEIAKLDFHLSHKDNNSLKLENPQFVRGAKLMSYEQEDDDGENFTITHYIQTEPTLSGKYIKFATVRRNALTNVPEIHFTFNAIGANKFAKITEKHIARENGGQDPRLLAIVLDGKLISAPSINGRIHAQGQITGNFTPEEAEKIASSLNNPLEIPLKIEEERDVAPSLGRDSITKGYNAAIWGLMAVAIFMLIYYLLSGVVANIALALNILILLGVLCWFDAALTLPGIAGVVLTIGMAVDANVLIYERIREELNVGKSLKGAIASGYDKAFWTIVDANITTMIASVILIYMGKGPVKGFGVTLTIGILASMFTALFVTRLVMDMLLRAGIIGSEKSKRLMHLRPSVNLPKFNFLKYAKPAFIASWALIIVGFGFGMMKGADKMLGVDFKGGYSLLMTLDAGHADQFNREIGDGTLRKNLATETGIDGASFQFQLRRDKVKDEHKLQVNFPIAVEDNQVSKNLAAKLASDTKELSEKAFPIISENTANAKIDATGDLNRALEALQLAAKQATEASKANENAREILTSAAKPFREAAKKFLEIAKKSGEASQAEKTPREKQAATTAQTEAEKAAEQATNLAEQAVDDNVAKVKKALNEQYAKAGLTHDKLDKVGPSVSGEIQKSALIAVMLAMFGILIYVAFRYEYSFAVGAVIAILHDVLMTGGWFFLSGRELNAPIVAAALTIIGFSINDTIVIFDRIRENLRMGTRGSFADVMNTALNQTLSRTIITSGTTLLSTATLYFFGGTVINDFAFTFLVGVITGTYSSIYIACAIVLWWHKGKRPELSALTVDADTVGVVTT